MSLFQQESGLKKYSKTLTIELLSKLGLKPNSLANRSFASSADSSVISYTSSTPDSSWMLWDIMEALSSHHNAELCKQSTESAPIKKNMTLADKLLAVDEEFTKHATVASRGGSMMTTLNTAIQQAEKEAERRYKMKLEQWKMFELTKVRTEEAEKANRMMNERVEQMGNNYAEQKKALENRERMAVERLTNHRKSLEAELHIQRQKLLQEMESLKSREELIDQQEKHIRKMEGMRMKELDMLKAATIKGLRSDNGGPIELQFQSSMTDVLMGQLDSMFKENNKLKTELSKLQEVATTNPPPSSKSIDHHDFYTSQNERLRMRIEELNNAILEMKSERDQRYQHGNLEGNLRQEVDDLKKMKNEQDLRQRQLEEMIRKMRDTIDQNTKAKQKQTKLASQASRNLFENNVKTMTSTPQKKYSPHVTPQRAIIHHNPVATLKQQDEEYEAVSRDVLFAHAPHIMKNNEERPMFKTCCTKERVKLLGEQSDALQRELDKYNERDFDRKLTETKRKFFGSTTTDGYDGCCQDGLKDDYRPTNMPQELSVPTKSPGLKDDYRPKNMPQELSVPTKSPGLKDDYRPKNMPQELSVPTKSPGLKDDYRPKNMPQEATHLESLEHGDDQHNISLPPPTGSNKADSVKEVSEMKDDDNNQQHSDDHSIKSETSASNPDNDNNNDNNNNNNDDNNNDDNNNNDDSLHVSLSSVEMSSLSRSKRSAFDPMMDDDNKLISSSSLSSAHASLLVKSSIQEISKLDTKQSSDDNSTTPKLNLKDLETRVVKSPDLVEDGKEEVKVGSPQDKKEEQKVSSPQDKKEEVKVSSPQDYTQKQQTDDDNTRVTSTDDASSSESFTSCPSQKEGGDVFERSSSSSPISLESRAYKGADDDSW